jgi:hypothetical protein
MKQWWVPDSKVQQAIFAASTLAQGSLLSVLAFFSWNLDNHPVY